MQVDLKEVLQATSVHVKYNRGKYRFISYIMLHYKEQRAPVHVIHTDIFIFDNPTDDPCPCYI